mmetsp:Transcript_16788/g.42001  ORF Transcript_16788/g.42001 Transcript_16788/m.42001 type:complete len:419 (+) Transcript_16788:93-1349(+)
MPSPDSRPVSKSARLLALHRQGIRALQRLAHWDPRSRASGKANAPNLVAGKAPCPAGGRPSAARSFELVTAPERAPVVHGRGLGSCTIRPARPHGRHADGWRSRRRGRWRGSRSRGRGRDAARQGRSLLPLLRCSPQLRRAGERRSEGVAPERVRRWVRSDGEVGANNCLAAQCAARADEGGLGRLRARPFLLGRCAPPKRFALFGARGLAVHSEPAPREFGRRGALVVARVVLEVGLGGCGLQGRGGAGGGRRGEHFRRLDVVGWSCEVDLHIRLDNADCLGASGREPAAFRLHLDHADVVLLVVVEDTNHLAFGEGREVAQSRLEHCLGVCDGDEVGRLRLQLDVGALGEGGRAHVQHVSLCEVQVLHHPVREVDHALLRDELEHAAVQPQLLVVRVGQLEHHGVADLEVHELLER